MACERIDGSLPRGWAPACCAALLAFLLPAATRGDDHADATPGPAGMLVVTGGDRLPGTLVAREPSAEIVWQSPAFVEPFRFPLGAIQVATFDAPPTAPPGKYRVELSGGGQINGDLVSLDESEIVLKTRWATLRVKRVSVACLGRGRPNGAKRRAGPVAVEKLVIDRAHAVLTDGKIVYGTPIGFDARAKRFSFQARPAYRLLYSDRPAAGQSMTLAADDVAEFFMAEPAASQDPARLEYADGTCLRGELLRIGDGNVIVKSSALVETVTMPLAGLRRLRMFSPAAGPPRRSGEAVLSLNGGRLHGRLVAAAPGARPKALAWKPSASSVAAAIRPGAAVSIDFGPPGLQNLLDNETDGGDRIFLRDGDVLRGNVATIGAVETALRLIGSSPVPVPNARIKAVEFGPPARGDLPADELSRLLTLPRLQKHDPPTHVVSSRRDDYLRGRLIAVDESQVVFEAGGVRRELRRDRVASIIWLNADDEPRPGAADVDLVQATDIDGLTLTLAADRLDDGRLVGRHELLGECRLPLDQLLRLDLGAPRVRPRLAQSYASWKLTDAIQPAAFADRAGATADEHARASELVGRPAPDCTLDLLDGSKFQLSKELGKAVVLDFWASWCAPCMKGLPELAALADGFDGENVRFVAVNLQETDDDARKAVERLNLSLPVGFDRDGRTAARYGVGSIPCTVVVGADGKVARVFVGFGPRMAEELKEAIVRSTE